MVLESILSRLRNSTFVHSDLENGPSFIHLLFSFFFFPLMSYHHSASWIQVMSSPRNAFKQRSCSLMITFLGVFFMMFSSQSFAAQRWYNCSAPLLWKSGIIINLSPASQKEKQEATELVEAFTLLGMQARANGFHAACRPRQGLVEANHRPTFSRGPAIDSLDDSQDWKKTPKKTNYIKGLR